MIKRSAKLKTTARFGRMLATAVMTAGLLSAGLAPVSFAQSYDYGTGSKTKTVVRQAAIGAGIGALGGALTERTSIGRGLGVGALTGAGTGLIETSDSMQRHPLVKNTLQGAVIGTGTSVARRGDTARGAVIGAGAGAGWHLLRNYLNDY
ncbi:MAG: hypothetical protein AB7P76_12730 [Candidatus Melainabacteria bacterium]